MTFFDNNQLIFGGAQVTDERGIEPSVSIRHVSTGKETRRLPLGQQDEQQSARAFSPEGRLLVSAYSPRAISGIGGYLSPVYLWDPARGKRIRQVGGKDIGARMTSFSPDGKSLATADWYQSLQLWEVATGKERCRFPGREWENIHCAAFSPSGRVLAAGDTKGCIRLWDLATRKELRTLQGHDRDVTCLSFSSDGRKLASGSEDTTALIWEVGGILDEAQPLVFPKADLKALWNNLADTDAAKAYQASWALVAAQNDATRFIQKLLQPVASVDARLAQLLVDLDGDSFEVRAKALRELEGLGELAYPALEKVLERKSSLEVRKRVEQILENPEPPVSSEELRALRAVEVLERIGTSEARKVLNSLAKGAPGAKLTEEAKASLGRLAKRHNESR